MTFHAIVDASKLSAALSPVSVLVDECKIHTNEDGLEIRAVDPANVGMVDTSPIPRSLPEVLDAVESNDTVFDINRRVAATSISATRRLLWELGLRDQSGQLLEDDVLEVRIGELREVFCDE